MSRLIRRRSFLTLSAGGLLAPGGFALPGLAAPAKQEGKPQQPTKPAPEHALTVISGTPRERGRQYGRAFKEPIREFLNREILAPFAKDAAQREKLLGYAAACAKVVAAFSPEIAEELAGAAEGAEVRLEELVLITLHEELYHRGVIPAAAHCTAMAIGPPDTDDGNTYVAETWDWMPSVFGLSSMVLWKRAKGPSLLGYAYPGLWAGAGLNSAGIALCWTSAALGQKFDGDGPRVGIPTYLLIAHLLYQDTLDAAIAEARRGQQAGWFTFVLADGKGRLANIEGSPKQVAVEMHRGHLARVYYGTQQMTKAPPGQPIPMHPRCRRTYELFLAKQGKLNRKELQRIIETPGISEPATIDQMIFNATTREAHLSRGPRGSGRWKRFAFDA
jgi:hypothetical protein